MKLFFLSVLNVTLLVICNHVSGMNKSPIDTLPESKSIEGANKFAPKIIGVVESTTGDKLPGATVALVGYSTAVSTDVQGGFTLIVPGANSYTLRTNYVGCISKDTPVEVSSAEKYVTIKLECDIFSSGQSMSKLNHIYDNSLPIFTSVIQRSVFERNY